MPIGDMVRGAIGTRSYYRPSPEASKYQELARIAAEAELLRQQQLAGPPAGVGGLLGGAEEFFNGSPGKRMAELRRFEQELMERAARGETEGRDQNPDKAVQVKNWTRDQLLRDIEAAGLTPEEAIRQKLGVLERERARVEAGHPFSGENFIEDRRTGEFRPPPEGREHGEASVVPPYYQGMASDDHRLPPELRRAIEESVEFQSIRGDRIDSGELIDGDGGALEPTDSPHILRMRHPNGTITYVHAADYLEADPRFEAGEYGLNDPSRRDGPGFPEDGWDPATRKGLPDPFWREGRREW